LQDTPTLFFTPSWGVASIKAYPCWLQAQSNPPEAEQKGAPIYQLAQLQI
jgi:hypothetical protein